jgi:hypothetical protein
MAEMKDAKCKQRKNGAGAARARAVREFAVPPPRPPSDMSQLLATWSEEDKLPIEGDLEKRRAEFRKELMARGGIGSPIPKAIPALRMTWSILV